MLHGGKAMNISISKIVEFGQLEAIIKLNLNDDWEIKDIHTSDGKWVVDFHREVCGICIGPVEDPEIGICDSCSDHAYGKMEKFL